MALLLDFDNLTLDQTYLDRLICCILIEDFGILENLEDIKAKSKSSFKKLVKVKAKEFAFYSYCERNLAKLDSLFYTELKLQNYLKSDEISVKQGQTTFSYRTRMAAYSENYRGATGPQPCPVCGLHLDSQSMSFECPVVKQNITITGKYTNIFKNCADSKLATTLIEIDKFRDEYIQSRKLN